MHSAVRAQSSRTDHGPNTFHKENKHYKSRSNNLFGSKDSDVKLKCLSPNFSKNSDGCKYIKILSYHRR